MTSEGYGILKNLLPAHHDPEIYKAEPYVLAADVYDNPRPSGAGRMELVYRRGRLVLPNSHRISVGTEAAGRTALRGTEDPAWTAWIYRRLADGTGNSAYLRFQRKTEKKPPGRGTRPGGIPIRDLSGEHKLEVVIQASGSI